jgi:hypothetical protein
MDAAAFADAVAERAQAALSRGPTRTQDFAIGPLGLQLTGPAGRPNDWMGRAFLPAPPGITAHRLTVWGGTDAASLPPPPSWDAQAIDPLGVVGSHSNDTVRCAIDIHTDSLIVSDFARGCSHTWYPGIASLPPWAKASPFRVPLSWLCNRHQMQIVHGAAVARDGRAVLLAGDGGSGKSTTALACALADFDYLGDDYCAVEPAAGKVHMVYRTAKLFKSTLALLPSMLEHIENRDRIDSEKGVAFLEPAHVRLAASAQLCAILLPRVGDAHAPMIRPARRDAVIKAILPSTIGGLMGGTAVTPRLILQLAHSVPAWHLALRPDTAAVVDAVATTMRAA